MLLRGMMEMRGSNFYSKTEEKLVVLRVFRGDIQGDSVALLKHL